MASEWNAGKPVQPSGPLRADWNPPRPRGGEATSLFGSQVTIMPSRASPRSASARPPAQTGALVTGLAPVGAIPAGALGDRLGVRAALVACALGVAPALLWAVLSPLPRLRALPGAAGETR